MSWEGRPRCSRGRKNAGAVGGQIGFEFVPLVVVTVVEARPPVGIGRHCIVGSVHGVAVVHRTDGNGTVGAGGGRDALGAVVAHGHDADDPSVSSVVDKTRLGPRAVVALVAGVQWAAERTERHGPNVDTSARFVVPPIRVFVVDHPLDTVERCLGVGSTRVGEDLDVDEKRSHTGARVNTVSTARAQSGGGHVRSVTLAVVRVDRSVGV